MCTNTAKCMWHPPVCVPMRLGGQVRSWAQGSCWRELDCEVSLCLIAQLTVIRSWSWRVWEGRHGGGRGGGADGGAGLRDVHHGRRI